MEEVILRDGDGLKILPETDEFAFKCCDCGLVHTIKVEHEGDNVVLRFYRDSNKSDQMIINKM
jgi:hypothetical protein